MDNVYDFWGRLVQGVLREDRIRQDALRDFSMSTDDSFSTTTTELSPNHSFSSGSFTIPSSNIYWQRGMLLRGGSSISVHEGINSDGLFFAVKEISLLDQGEEGQEIIYQLEQEIARLSQLEHENILQYYGSEKDGSKFYIFYELVTKGSLMSLYKKYHISDSQAANYTRQILHGLKYLHDQDMVHRDVKCSKILMDANGTVKLYGFGLAEAPYANTLKHRQGTVFWQAPEVRKRQIYEYGHAADIWSLGCTVLEMLTRRFPYSHLKPMQALGSIRRGEPPQVPESLSKDARDFILQCLQVNPNSRPSATELLDHPFVKSFVSPPGAAGVSSSSSKGMCRNGSKRSSEISHAQKQQNVEVKLTELDPPLPVVKKVQPPPEVSLWKRRSGGMTLKNLQIEQIHHLPTNKFQPAPADLLHLNFRLGHSYS